MASLDPADDPIPVSPGLKPSAGPSQDYRRGFAATRVIMALILREMTARYGRTPGGYVWAILEPIGIISVLALGFSLLVRAPALGTSFILFYASGYLVFAQYRSVEGAVTKSIPYARGLLRYPVVTWLDTILARFLLNTLTGILNSILILSVIIYVTASNMMVDYLLIVLALALASFLALGIGTLNALLTGLWPIWNTLIGILSRPLMIASAVFFILEDMSPAGANILWYNPLVHLTGLMRTGVYFNYAGQYISIVYVVAVSLITLTIGLVFLRRYATTIISDD